MEAKKQDRSVGTAQSRKSPEYRVLVIHDNVLVFKRERHLIDTLSKRMGSGANYRFTWWNLHHLQHTPIAALACEVGTHCSHIIFAIHSVLNPTEQLTAWLRHSLAGCSGQKPGMILITTPSTIEHGGPVAEFATHLREIAGEHEVDLEIIPEWSLFTGDETVSQEIELRAHAFSPVLSSALDLRFHRPPHGWHLPH